MKVWKISILFLGAVIVLGMANVPVLAESDETGDLWHWYYSETNWGWGEATGHPNIDITDVSYSKNGLEVTLSMTVAGSIQDSETIIYYIYSGEPEENYYWVMYMNGVCTWGATGFGGYSGGMINDPLSGDGKTLTATFNLTEDTTISPHANTIEYSQLGDISTSEWWQDWYPNEYFQEALNGDDGTENGDGTPPTGTPGFELVALVIAAAISLIVYKRRR